MSTDVVAVPVARVGRSVALDGLRGLAVASMIVDHLTLVLGGPSAVRLTVGRIAMPLFFIIAGHLVRRISWRTGWVALLGLVLPLAVPWIDAPNVLLSYAIGAVLIVACRWAELSPWLLVVIALGAAANGWVQVAGPSYDLRALVGLMAVGALIPRGGFAWGTRFRLLAPLGRYPLTVYVGHVLLLQLAILRAST